MHKRWRRANLRLVPATILLISGAAISLASGGVRWGDFDHRLIAVAGVMLFVVFAVIFLHVFTDAVRRQVAAHRLGAGRAAAIQFTLRVTGYIVILLVTLDLLGVPVGRILVGGAVLSIILGVAAQQALANFFASIVLVISHPFTVGEAITLHSGALGGTYSGTVVDIGLTHTKLQEESGKIIFLPNTALLLGAAITAQEPRAPSKR